MLMIEIQSNNYTQNKKLICDWTDEKNFLIHCKTLNFYIRRGMIVGSVREMISSRQSKLLDKNVSFDTQRTNLATNGFEKDFFKILKNAFYGKTIKNARKTIEINLIKKDDNEKFIKQQSKIIFNCIRKYYTSYGSFIIKQNEVLMDRPIYVESAVLEISELHMFGTYYEKLQAYFGKKTITWFGYG